MTLQELYTNCTTELITRNHNNPGSVYYLKIVINDNVVYKIGYTARTVADRVGDFSLPKHAKIYLIDSFSDLPPNILMSFDKYVHSTISSDFYYQGKCLIANGNSELYIHDVLGLDVKHFSELIPIYGEFSNKHIPDMYIRKTKKNKRSFVPIFRTH